MLINLKLFLSTVYIFFCTSINKIKTFFQTNSKEDIAQFCADFTYDVVFKTLSLLDIMAQYKEKTKLKNELKRLICQNEKTNMTDYEMLLFVKNHFHAFYNNNNCNNENECEEEVSSDDSYFDEDSDFFPELIDLSDEERNIIPGLSKNINNILKTCFDKRISKNINLSNPQEKETAQQLFEQLKAVEIVNELDEKFINFLSSIELDSTYLNIHLSNRYFPGLISHEEGYSIFWNEKSKELFSPLVLTFNTGDIINYEIFQKEKRRLYKLIHPDTNNNFSMEDYLRIDHLLQTINYFLSQQQQ